MRHLLALSSLALLLLACGGGSGASDTTGDGSVLPEVSGDDSLDPAGIEVEIVADVLQGNAPLEVHFSAILRGVDPADVDYAWDFDNGSTSSEAEPVMVFTDPQTYKVDLRVTRRGTIFTAEDDELIRVNATADLRLSDVTVSGPTNVAPGGTTRLTFQVRNSGGAVEEPFLLRAFVSQNEVLDATDPLAREVEIDGITSGIYAESTLPFTDMSITLPEDAAAGTWYVIVWVDAEGVVTEADEENNIRVASSILQVDPSASEQPDLLVSELVAPTSSPLSQGTNLNYHLTIRNEGTADAKTFKFDVHLSIDSVLDPEDRKITDDQTTTIFSLEAGGMRSFVKAFPLPAELPDGDYYLIARVDSQEQVVEGDEANNQRVSAQPVVVRYQEPQGIDLAVMSFETVTTIVYIGGQVATKLSVRNLGTQDAGAFSYTFFLSKEPYLNPNTDFDLGTFTGPKVPAKAEITLETLVTISSATVYDVGTYYLSVFLDRSNSIKELEDGNNTETAPQAIEVTKDKNVDLEAVAVEFHPEAVAAGGIVTLSQTIRNLGSSHSGGFFSAVALSPDATISAEGVASGADLVIARMPVGGVGPGQTLDVVTTVTVPLALPNDVSVYHVGIVVDPTNAVAGELSEANNVAVAADTLSVSGTMGGCYEDAFEPNDAQADAVVLPTGATEGLGLCGDDDWYRVAVPKGYTVTVELLLVSPLYLEPRPFDLDLLVTKAGGSLNKKGEKIGAYEKVVILSNPDDAPLLIRVYPKEPGNEAHYSLVVHAAAPPDQPDLVVDRVIVQPDQMYPGGVVQVLAEVYNLGKAPTGTFAAHLYLSTDPALDDADLFMGSVEGIALPPFGWALLEETPILPVTSGGPHYVLLKADGQNDVAEADEANNVGVSGEIRLDDTLVCLQDDFEPNDVAGVAAPLAATSGVYGDLSVCPGLDDWYVVDLPAGKAFSATVHYDHVAASGSIRVELLDGDQLAIVDASLDPAVPFIALPYVYAPGPYLLRVRVQDPEGGTGEPYEYTLGVSVSDPDAGAICEPDPEEFDNAFELASDLGCGESTHTLCNKDVDIFHARVEQGDTFRATAQHAEKALKASLVLEPGDAPVDTATGNGSVQIQASSDLDVWVVVEALNPFAPLSSFEYQIFVEGVAGVDVVPAMQAAVPASVKQGEDVLADLILDNDCADAAGGFAVSVYVSADDALDAADVLVMEQRVEGIPGLGSVTLPAKVSVPLDTPPGQAFLLLQADSDDEVDESHETNNVVPLALEVVSVCDDDVFEPNDDPAYAATLAGMGSYLGLMLCEDDLDWYRLKLDAGASVRVAIAHDPEKGDLDVRLYAASNLVQYLAAGQASPEGEALTYTAASGGWYLIRVGGFLEAQNAYDLLVTAP